MNKSTSAVESYPTRANATTHSPSLAASTFFSSASNLAVGAIAQSMTAAVTTLSAVIAGAAQSFNGIVSGQYMESARRERNLRWVQEFLDIAGLADGWNGAHSLAPSPKVLDNVLRVIASAQRGGGDFTLTPNDSGTVSIEWESSGGYALLEIGLLQYALTIDDVNGMPVFENGLYSELNVDRALARIDTNIFRTVKFAQSDSMLSPSLMTSIKPTFYARVA
ncbi:hypothetical protein [Curtobacterium flaccumfaciens]|nr:hypothetical protein [Curtobacterium flaccumfaciens]UWD85860.1 hypothetical protein NY059_16270 [Curtobacterium flaccumfaciens pv. betae]